MNNKSSMIILNIIFIIFTDVELGRNVVKTFIDYYQLL